MSTVEAVFEDHGKNQTELVSLGVHLRENMKKKISEKNDLKREVVFHQGFLCSDKGMEIIKMYFQAF